MGFWADSFGGGNSFTESVANVFTPGDGATYVNGNLVNTNDNTPITLNETGGGTTNTGVAITGSANDSSTGHVVQAGQTLSQISQDTGVSVEQLMALNNIEDPNQIQAGAALKTTGSFFKDGVSIYDTKSNNTVKGTAPTGLANLAGFASPLGIMGKIAGWANGLNPEEDLKNGSVIDNRQVYTQAGEGGISYSYNFLGMPYEVKIKEGKVVDANTLDAQGRGPSEEGFDKSTTRYEIEAQKARNNGDNDGADQILQEAANNANTTAPAQYGDGSEGTENLTASEIAKMAEEAGVVKNQGEMEAILSDPNKFLKDRGLNLSDIVPSMDANTAGTLLDPTDTGYGLGENSGYTAVGTGEASTVADVIKPDAVTYDAQMNELTDNEMVNAVTGTVRDEALVDAEEYTIDMQGAATGINADGTQSVLGEALNDFASQNISTVIDTTTVAGKLLAQKLGEGNYVDAKATVIGQMKIISEEFKGVNGEPIIPVWAQAMHRDASKSIAFNGISGTAQTAAFSNAIMEATLGVAEKDATFFQTLTTKNLDNRQEAIINKANVLSKLEIANLDARSQAAVQNAKSFMQMDLANLDNRQQAEVVNKQALVQSMFDNTAAVNAERLFTAKTENEVNKFFAELQNATDRHNSSEINALNKFNTGEINDAAQFTADIRNDREKFLATMQYNIDISNAKWRQTVETTNNKTVVDAHTADIKAALDLTQEAQNALWDSADNLLDYIWKTADSDMERELRLLTAQMTVQSGQSSGGGFLDGLLKLGGAYLGSSSGSSWLTSIMPSDTRLKDNIQHYDTLKGINFYTWDWNDEGRRIGADQYPSFGVLAQEVEKTHPAAVVQGSDGYLRVNYGMINNDV